MNLQVNLLKKTEQRYQGIVSMKLLIAGSVAVFAGILLIFLLLSGIAKMTLNANIERARSEWTQREPVAGVIRGQSEAAAQNRRTLSMLEEWSGRVNAPMYKILHDLQQCVPAQIQLSRLYAGVVPDPEKGTPEFRMQLNGWAVGQGGDLLAVDFKRDLNDNPVIRNFCSEIRLVSSQRETGDVWLFALEGSKKAEGAQ